jgi:hypothetical protein
MEAKHLFCLLQPLAFRAFPRARHAQIIENEAEAIAERFRIGPRREEFCLQTEQCLRIQQAAVPDPVD